MDDVELVRDFSSSWSPEHLAGDVEWRLAEGFPSGGACRGRAAVPFAHVWWLREGRIAAFDQHNATLMLQRAIEEEAERETASG